MFPPNGTGNEQHIEIQAVIYSTLGRVSGTDPVRWDFEAIETSCKLLAI